MLWLRRAAAPSVAVADERPLATSNVMDVPLFLLDMQLVIAVVDLSFYQVARGMVFRLTVGTTFFLLHTWPSLRISTSYPTVTARFFAGVYMNETNVSAIGVTSEATAGAVSSMIAASCMMKLLSVRSPRCMWLLPTPGSRRHNVGLRFSTASSIAIILLCSFYYYTWVKHLVLQHAWRDTSNGV
ncbi:uncharacterized protein B0H18DRAFT_1219234 [Fomitopsis serialis]|uniref:uncharacterized protein n=1 Tax=Fomitopsis serialis TaxID=139415 RepID=UPI002008DD99|nr:uncharacterized protein B0H18DRAFT_1219234 [Neoantrodia serialis]KAH9910420.1 hypothetical protein B0H18DRAFT_1219234 [Neoantrodia serialis]